eukprot:TRINITY_DN893_c1_g2_i1.p1 TRINITY_DN893_c1_g2~~TRINITY_DN893_c1_g2_i1.p1  ORF type:complete len:1354 (-),score=298.92 TRINITY_DN893_c1_g2_i1:2192-6253(-)
MAAATFATVRATAAGRGPHETVRGADLRGIQAAGMVSNSMQDEEEEELDLALLERVAGEILFAKAYERCGFRGGSHWQGHQQESPPQELGNFGTLSNTDAVADEAERTRQGSSLQALAAATCRVLRSERVEDDADGSDPRSPTSALPRQLALSSCSTSPEAAAAAVAYSASTPVGSSRSTLTPVSSGGCYASIAASTSDTPNSASSPGCTEEVQLKALLTDTARQVGSLKARCAQQREKDDELVAELFRADAVLADHSAVSDELQRRLNALLAEEVKDDKASVDVGAVLLADDAAGVGTARSEHGAMLHQSEKQLQHLAHVLDMQEDEAAERQRLLALLQAQDDMEEKSWRVSVAVIEQECHAWERAEAAAQDEAERDVYMLKAELQSEDHDMQKLATEEAALARKVQSLRWSDVGGFEGISRLPHCDVLSDKMVTCWMEEVAAQSGAVAAAEGETRHATMELAAAEAAFAEASQAADAEEAELQAKADWLRVGVNLEAQAEQEVREQLREEEMMCKELALRLHEADRKVEQLRQERSRWKSQQQLLESLEDRVTKLASVAAQAQARAVGETPRTDRSEEKDPAVVAASDLEVSRMLDAAVELLEWPGQGEAKGSPAASGDAAVVKVHAERFRQGLQHFVSELCSATPAAGQPAQALPWEAALGNRSVRQLLAILRGRIDELALVQTSRTNVQKPPTQQGVELTREMDVALRSIPSDVESPAAKIVQRGLPQRGRDASAERSKHGYFSPVAGASPPESTTVSGSPGPGRKQLPCDDPVAHAPPLPSPRAVAPTGLGCLQFGVGQNNQAEAVASPTGSARPWDNVQHRPNALSSAEPMGATLAAGQAACASGMHGVRRSDSARSLAFLDGALPAQCERACESKTADVRTDFVETLTDSTIQHAGDGGVRRTGSGATGAVARPLGQLGLSSEPAEHIPAYLETGSAPACNSTASSPRPRLGGPHVQKGLAQYKSASICSSVTSLSGLSEVGDEGGPARGRGPGGALPRAHMQDFAPHAAPLQQQQQQPMRFPLDLHGDVSAVSAGTEPTGAAPSSRRLQLPSSGPVRAVHYAGFGRPQAASHFAGLSTSTPLSQAPSALARSGVSSLTSSLSSLHDGTQGLQALSSSHEELQGDARKKATAPTSYPASLENSPAVPSSSVGQDRAIDIQDAVCSLNKRLQLAQIASEVVTPVEMRSESSVRQPDTRHDLIRRQVPAARSELDAAWSSSGFFDELPASPSPLPSLGGPRSMAAGPPAHSQATSAAGHPAFGRQPSGAWATDGLPEPFKAAAATAAAGMGAAAATAVTLGAAGADANAAGLPDANGRRRHAKLLLRRNALYNGWPLRLGLCRSRRRW